MTREISTGAAATIMLIALALFVAGFLAGAFYTQERQTGETGRPRGLIAAPTSPA